MVYPTVIEVKRQGGLKRAWVVENARREARAAHLEAIRLAPENKRLKVHK